MPFHKRIFIGLLSKWVNQLPKGKLILELGCGLGDWIGLISSNSHKVVGLDIDSHACKVATARVGKVSAGIVLYSGEALPFNSNSFVGAYAHEVIEHVQNDKEFLSEIYRVLTTNGSLLLTTPNANREPLDPEKHRAHIRHYVPNNLLSILKDQNFIIDVLYWRMHPICGIIDDSLFAIGTKLLRTHSLQPGLTEISYETQSKRNRFLIALYKIVEPILLFITRIEFELFKTHIEARNMIILATKSKKEKQET